MKTTKFRIITVAAILCLALIAGAAAAVYAKYVVENHSHFGIISPEFIFVSDYLAEGEEEIPVYTVYGKSVTFTVFNFEGENKAGANITYTVTENNGKWNAANSSYTLARSKESGESFTVEGNPGETYEITAKSSAPYEKVLRAKFVFATRESYYTVTNGERFVQIDIYTADVFSGITVKGTEGLIPDKTNDKFNGSSIGRLEADSHYTFVYFKTEDKDYTAVEKTPLANEITLTPSSN